MGNEAKNSRVHHSKEDSFLFPSLEKRGQGRFLGRVRLELCSGLLGQDTRRARIGLFCLSEVV